MISVKHGFLFIHIPKTGGNAIQNNLKEYSEDKVICLHPNQDGVERFEVTSDQLKIQKHSTLSDYREQLTPDTFKNLFKFTCVRNPWERVISFYFSPHRGTVHWDRDQFIAFMRNIIPSEAYMSLGGENNYAAYFDNIDGFIRFDRLNDDFEKVCDLIGIPRMALYLRNKSERKHYTAYYDDELREIVRARYHEEIKYFGYEFNQSPSACLDR